MEPIILASASLRRQEILKQLGFPFTVMTPKIDETIPDGMDIGEGVADIARRKVGYVLSVINDRYLPWVLGADTLIFNQGAVIGKPSSREEAEAIISSLQGREHSVFTGLAIYSGRTKEVQSSSNETKVRFRPLSKEEIEWYLDSGEWQGVAGGYRIQSLASLFIDRIEGQFHSVVGLPISDLYGILRLAGYQF